MAEMSSSVITSLRVFPDSLVQRTVRRSAHMLRLFRRLCFIGAGSARMAQNFRFFDASLTAGPVRDIFHQLNWEGSLMAGFYRAAVLAVLTTALGVSVATHAQDTRVANVSSNAATNVTNDV